MRVAVTGGSGVVGGAVIRHLVAAGHEVQALARTCMAAASVEALGARAVSGDLFDRSALDALALGCERLFHIAGVNEMCPRNPQLMDRVNVEGTLSVVEAWRRRGAGRLVHTSSAAAIGEAPGTVGDEASPHRGYFLSRYEESKYRAETALIDAAADIDYVIVNPSSVQGPGRATGTGKLIIDLIEGRLTALIDTTISIVDIDDCARGHLLASEKGETGRRYLLNGFTMSVAEAVRMLEGVVGRPINVRYLPGAVAAAGAAVIEGAYRLLGRKPLVCREMVRVLRHGHRYDGSRATAELGLQYAPPRETIEALARWIDSKS